jgi:two-component system response regulator HydG
MNSRILLVDDNKEFLDSTKDVLEMEGFDVVTATSGEESLMLTKTQSFEVVVMDIKMPGMNGVESFVAMKKQNPDVKVIIVTAYSVEELIQQAKDEGAYAVLNKPLDMDLVTKKINELNKKSGEGLILIAEDDQALCENLREILEAEGYGVVTAHDSKEAIKSASEQPFDIVLIDMQLPVLNGLEVYRRIKAILPDIVAIIISAYGKQMHDLIEQALKESAHTFLRKPLKIDALLKTIKEISAY